MTDMLSIRAAAACCGDRPAIITATQTLTFAECAAAVSTRHTPTLPRHVVATPSVETILAIYGALEAERPLALLHARLAKPELDRQASEANAARLPSGAAVVLFTSGSTGKPRGVVLSRTALVAAADASATHLGWRDDDRWLSCLPLAHAGGLSIVIRCLAARRPVVLNDSDFDPQQVIALATASRTTLISLVPTQLAAILDASPHRSAQLRIVLVGGAPATPALIGRAIAAGLPIRRTYGLTETFGQVATARAAHEAPVPLPGLTIIAGTQDRPAPIRISGPMLATEYLDGAPIAPELTTADLGYLDQDRGLHVIGRADDMIITGGENVHPAEIEAVLAATPGVRAACVFGVPDPRWGQIVAAAIATDPVFDRATALVRWRHALPAHARPRKLAITVLPLLPSGKIDRRAAAALPLSPVDE